MGLTKEQNDKVEQVLKNSLRDKFQNYNPEPHSMPFHTRLLGGDRLALHAFIHSLMTTFGAVVFEPVALAIAKSSFKNAKSQAIAGDFIYQGALAAIDEMMRNLTIAASKANKLEEIETIRKVCQNGSKKEVKPLLADLLVETNNGEFFLFDLKTVKPNKGDFIKFKRTLLEWVAALLASNPNADVNTLIAIPYNPYEPKPYARWTMVGMLDLQRELKVADGFWDFLGGQGTYQDLLDCFEKVGIELRNEIDEYFARFNKL